MSKNFIAGRAGSYNTSTPLLKTSTIVGPGDAIDLAIPMQNHMCTAIWGGTAPTSLTFAIEGSEDGTNFAALATVTMTVSPTIFHVQKPSVRYIRGNYIAKVAGDDTTSISLTCTSGGN